MNQRRLLIGYATHHLVVNSGYGLCRKLYSFLFLLFKEIERKHSWLDEGQKRVVASYLRSARNGGVALEGKDKERFNAIQMKLAELGNRFRWVKFF